jgi:hypothetical protein
MKPALAVVEEHELDVGLIVARRNVEVAVPIEIGEDR